MKKIKLIAVFLLFAGVSIAQNPISIDSVYYADTSGYAKKASALVDSSAFVKYTGNDKDLDMGAYKVTSQNAKITGLAGVGTRLGTVASDGTLVANDPLTSNYIPYWDGSKLANTNAYFDGTNWGIRTTTPTAKLSVSEKSAMNELGGFMVKLTNKTGANSVKGTVVYADPDVDNAFEVNPINGDMPFGVVYENGVADGSECWVVVSGIAEVLLVNTAASTRSYVAYSSSSVAGRIDISASVPAAATHFREIGHTLESKVGGTNVLCKCLVHFN